MSTLPILSVPDPKLRQQSQPVNQIDDSLIQLVRDMTDTLINKTDPPGVGLSAIQIGEPLRLFLSYLPKDRSLPSKQWNKENMEIVVYVNPRIVKASDKMTLGGKKDKPALEGCLSIPHLYGPVPRHEWLELEYETFDPQTPKSGIRYQASTKRSRFEAFPARVIQHELDHLDGILFTDRNLEANLPLYLEDEDALVELKDPRSLITW